MNESEELLFEETTPPGFKVSVTKSYWEYIITVKHPHIKGMDSGVIDTLKNPEFTAYITDRIKEGVQIWKKSK